MAKKTPLYKSVRIHAEEYRLAKIQAATQGMSLSKWFGEAVRAYAKRKS